MEQEIFGSFKSNFGMSATDKSGHAIDLADIQSTLVEFNLTGKEAANAAPKWQDNCTLNLLFCDPTAYADRKETELNAKIAVLDRKLAELGLGSIPTYSADTAAKNQQTYLGDLRHQPYPGDASSDPFMGILLPHDDCPIIGVDLGCK